jgi:4'-phosphopantetheinyl transferase
VSRLRYLSVGVGDLPIGTAWLSDIERDTVRSLRVTKRRLDWLLGRYVAKCALAAYGRVRDTSLARWDIRAARDGAPQAWCDGRRLDLAISLSHSGGRALCVVAPAQIAPGCDIERIETRGPAFVETFFTIRERRLVAEVDNEARDLLVTLLWSAKESALKSLRQGLRKDTRSVDVRVDLEGRPGDWQPFLIDQNGPTASLPGWWRREAGFVLTVAADRPTGMPQPLASNTVLKSSLSADTCG